MRFDWSRLGGVEDAARDLRWTAAELAAAVSVRRGVLARFGTGPGRRVMIAHGGSPEFVADLLAVWSLGAAAICVDAGLTAGEVATLRDYTGAVAILVRGGASCPGLGVPVLEAGAEAAGNDPGDLAGALDDEALILFTLGTTGQPKGVVHSFRSLFARAALNRQQIGAALGRSLCVLPTHFGHGLIGNCLTPLLAGGDVVFPGLPAMRPGRSVGRPPHAGLVARPLRSRAARAIFPPSRGNPRRASAGQAVAS